jgi:hypothetical protein
MMGNFKAVIEGIGAHHNGAPYDADAMISRVVAKMNEAGHTITSAVFHHGADSGSPGTHDLILAPSHTDATVAADPPDQQQQPAGGPSPAEQSPEFVPGGDGGAMDPDERSYDHSI